MKHRRLFLFSIILILVLNLSLIGCKKQTMEEKAESRTIDLDELSAEEATELGDVISEEETPFVKIIDGEEVFVEEVDPTILKIMGASTEIVDLLFNIDYETATGKEHFNMLTEDYKKRFEESNMAEEDVEVYKEHKIQQTVLGTDKYHSIKIDGATAVVDMDILFIFSNIENFHNFEIGETYSLPLIWEFKLEDGEWKLDRRHKTDRQIYTVSEDE